MCALLDYCELKKKVIKMPGSIAVMSDGKKNYVKPGHSSAECENSVNKRLNTLSYTIISLTFKRVLFCE